MKVLFLQLFLLFSMFIIVLRLLQIGTNPSSDKDEMVPIFLH